MKNIPVENHPNLTRESSSKAVINNDKTGFNSYIAAREKMNSDKERIDTLETKVDDLKGDLNEIKKMLRSISNG